jgi:hypothetical protein
VSEHRIGSPDELGKQVEVGRLPDGDVYVRSAANPQHGPVLKFTQQEWAAFVAGVKNGEFDPNEAWAPAGAMSPDR